MIGASWALAKVYTPNLFDAVEIVGEAVAGLVVAAAAEHGVAAAAGVEGLRAAQRHLEDLKARHASVA